MELNLKDKLDTFLTLDNNKQTELPKKVVKKRKVVQEIVDNTDKVIIVENKQLLFS